MAEILVPPDGTGTSPNPPETATRIHVCRPNSSIQNWVQHFSSPSWVARKADLRKPLKAVIDADTEFQAKLRALKSSADADKNQADKYDFLLTSVLDTIDSSEQEHRQLLEAQEEAAKHKKK